MIVLQVSGTVDITPYLWCSWTVAETNNKAPHVSSQVLYNFEVMLKRVQVPTIKHIYSW